MHGHLLPSSIPQALTQCNTVRLNVLKIYKKIYAPQRDIFLNRPSCLRNHGIHAAILLK
jgi:hypothetical protein